jgi:hypothetical protein
MRQFLIILVFLITSTTTFGQTSTKELNGILTTKNGDAIPGCNVLIKGQVTSVSTQSCGEFKITVPDNYEGVLVFSCLTPRVWEIPIKKLKDIDKVIITLNDWREFENGPCDKNFKKEKKIKIK